MLVGKGKGTAVVAASVPVPLLLKNSKNTDTRPSPNLLFKYTDPALRAKRNVAYAPAWNRRSQQRRIRTTACDDCRPGKQSKSQGRRRWELAYCPASRKRKARALRGAGIRR